MEERVAVLEARMKAQEDNWGDFRKDMRERLNRLEMGVLGILVGVLGMLAKQFLDAAAH